MRLEALIVLATVLCTILASNVPVLDVAAVSKTETVQVSADIPPINLESTIPKEPTSSDQICSVTNETEGVAHSEIPLNVSAAIESPAVSARNVPAPADQNSNHSPIQVPTEENLVSLNQLTITSDVPNIKDDHISEVRSARSKLAELISKRTAADQIPRDVSVKGSTVDIPHDSEQETTNLTNSEAIRDRKQVQFPADMNFPSKQSKNPSPQKQQQPSVLKQNVPSPRTKRLVTEQWVLVASSQKVLDQAKSDLYQIYGSRLQISLAEVAENTDEQTIQAVKEESSTKQQQPKREQSKSTKTEQERRHHQVQPNVRLLQRPPSMNEERLERVPKAANSRQMIQRQGPAHVERPQTRGKKTLHHLIDPSLIDRNSRRHSSATPHRLRRQYTEERFDDEEYDDSDDFEKVEYEFEYDDDEDLLPPPPPPAQSQRRTAVRERQNTPLSGYEYESEEDDNLAQSQRQTTAREQEPQNTPPPGTQQSQQRNRFNKTFRYY